MVVNNVDSTLSELFQPFVQDDGSQRRILKSTVQNEHDGAREGDSCNATDRPCDLRQLPVAFYSGNKEPLLVASCVT